MYFLHSYDATIKIINEELNKSYSNLLGRFSVHNNLGDDSSASQEPSLKILLARVNQDVIQCTTDRENECEALRRLTNKLRVFTENSSDAEMKHATLFLLGGLIHRFYRIETEYKNYNESSLNLFSYFSKKTLWDVNSCRLYVAIKKALQLDKRPLDEVTIVTSLEVFQQNMLQMVLPEEGDKLEMLIKVKRYMTYPHLSKDVNFERNLQIMIDEHSQKGAYELQQFRALCFIETLAQQLEESRKQLEKEINEWSQCLRKVHKEFKQIDEELIMTHLNSYIKAKIDNIPNKANLKDKKEDPVIASKILFWESIKEQIKALLFNVDLDKLESYPELWVKIFQDNVTKNLCILCGGYSLLVHNGDKVDERLLEQVKTALGLVGELTAEEERDCIQSLLLYVNKEPIPILNCDFFKGRANMVTAVTQLSSALDLAKKQRETKAKEAEDCEREPSSPSAHVMI